MSNNANGKWITTDKGVHIFIKNGQSVEEAFDDFDIDNGVDFDNDDFDFSKEDNEIYFEDYTDLPEYQDNKQTNPVPEIDYKSSFKDGYKVEENKVTLGKGRIDWLIDEYGVWNENRSYAKGYLAYINPEDFIELTTGNEITRKHVFKNANDLDLDRMNNESQTPFLIIDFDTNEVVGHEGRHRLASFVKAGITQVPIVIRDESKSFNKNRVGIKNFNGEIKGQTFGDHKANDRKLNFEAIPLNYGNYDKLLERFTK